MDLIEDLKIIDWAIIGAFFITTLLIGLAFSKKGTGSLTEYFVAGRKMNWFVAGTSIVATSFAADTPLVISGWMRTVGLERNWFWWGAIMGMMLCAFFFARLWRRANVLTDIEFNELRYHGTPAAGLRMFHATYRSIIANTLVMGWVTLAMAKIMDVTLDIPTLVFVEGSWLPQAISKGVEISSVISLDSIAHWSLIGEAIIPAKATGIIICLLVATLYTVFAGLWGVMATDLFQFFFAMLGAIVLMFIALAQMGAPGLQVSDPQTMVVNAKKMVKEGKVINTQLYPRYLVKDEEVKALKIDNKETLATLFIPASSATDTSSVKKWADPSLSHKRLIKQLDNLAIPQDKHTDIITLWENSFTVSKAHFLNFAELEKILAANILVQAYSENGKEHDYYRFTDISLSQNDLEQKLNRIGVEDKSEIFAAWRRDRVIVPFKITNFLPPFDLKGGGLLAIWTLVVFLGLQWWAAGAGDGFLAQRLFSCKNEKHSMMAMLWFNFTHFALRPWPWIVVGVASLFLIPDVTAYGKHYDAEHAYVIMLMKYMPDGLKGLMVASLMAAYMSTISTHVNFGASYVVNDLYKRFINPNCGGKKIIRVSQMVSLFLAVLAGIYAYYSNSIATGWLIFFELMSGSGLVILARWYWWRINVWSEISAMTASLSMYALLNWTSLFHILFEFVGLSGYFLDEYAVRFSINLLCSTTIWITVTMLTPSENEEHLIRFYKRIRPSGLWKPIREKAQIKNVIRVGRFEWMAWILGVTGLFSLIFAIGKVCFGFYYQSLFFALYAFIAIFAVLKLIDRMDWSEIEEQ